MAAHRFLRGGDRRHVGGAGQEWDRPRSRVALVAVLRGRVLPGPGRVRGDARGRPGQAPLLPSREMEL